MRTVLWALVAALLVVPTMGAKEVPCQASARQALERGYALLHSFEYEWARLEFEAAVIADPECTLAHVGEALTYNRTLRAPRSPHPCRTCW